MKKQSKLKQIKKRIRKRTLFFLAIALIANSFAWFIYTNKVSNSITTGVRSWKITFDQDGHDLEEDLEFNFDDIYPGIAPQVKTIDITNNGEMTAYISYHIESVQIFDDLFTSEDHSQEELINILNNNYPFNLSFANSDTEITVGQTGKFSATLNWPFESGDDAADTYYGKKSYEFKQESDEPQIKIVVKIKASQTKD